VGHNTLNWHLTFAEDKEDPMCPLCGEEHDTRLHLLGRCSALVGKWRKQFGKHFSQFQANSDRNDGVHSWSLL